MSSQSSDLSVGCILAFPPVTGDTRIGSMQGLALFLLPFRVQLGRAGKDFHSPRYRFASVLRRSCILLQPEGKTDARLKNKGQKGMHPFPHRGEPNQKA